MPGKPLLPSAAFYCSVLSFSAWSFCSPVQFSFSLGIRLEHNHFYNYYLNAMFMFDYREQGQQQALPAATAGPSAFAVLAPFLFPMPCSALIDIFSMHIETHPWPRSHSPSTSTLASFSCFLPSLPLPSFLPSFRNNNKFPICLWLWP